MITIYLNKLLFHSYHGVHDEEKVLGGKFQIDLEVKYYPQAVPVNKLEETVNYVSLYSLVKKRMEQPTELLETIATELASKVLQQFTIVDEVSITITKLHPPITSFQGSVGVNYILKRQH